MGRKTKSIERQIKERLGEIKHNNQNCLMKIVVYNNATDIIVEFQDEYKSKVHTQYSNFKRGNVKNPYHRSVYGVGIIGDKYLTHINGKYTKEYDAWQNMLSRCFDIKMKEYCPTYENVTCCEEWLLYENFYEWLHEQDNFNKWFDNNKWDVDKDIIIKGNKIYSSETCCLVPPNVNKLFVKCDATRGNLPIGVTKCNNKFVARCMNPFIEKKEYIGSYNTSVKAFNAYKSRKEDLIKQVAQTEYDKGNITEKCYNAMLNYKVEITD